MSAVVNPATLLVVDDDRILVDTLSSWLEAEGFEVCRAYDGLQGLAAARRTNPDLVLADVSMPGLDGLHLAARVREQGIPIVLISAADPPQGLHPDTPFLSKPFDIEEIYRVIVEMLAERKSNGAFSNGH